MAFAPSSLILANNFLPLNEALCVKRNKQRTPKVATTVTSAFNIFLKDFVNLDPENSKNARSSRDWLVSKVHGFPDNDSSFPMLYSEKDIFFGSFARKTKKRPLDDIDIMICLNAQGGNYSESSDGIEVNVSESASDLKALCYDNTNILNSRKVINKLVSLLNGIPQYERAEIKRNQEAATIKLTSYDWNFDLVPCFFTTEDYLGNTYYLIPDGTGDWKKTDPRKDRDRVQEANKQNDGNLLNAIRILKYWNKRPTMPSMGSYLIENMILNYYDQPAIGAASEYIDLEIPNLLLHIRDSVYGVVNDPKGIQGNINNLTSEEKSKIWDRANADYIKAVEARSLESNDNHKGSINKWREVFGGEFPEYG